MTDEEDIYGVKNMSRAELEATVIELEDMSGSYEDHIDGLVTTIVVRDNTIKDLEATIRDMEDEIEDLMCSNEFLEEENERLHNMLGDTELDFD